MSTPKHWLLFLLLNLILTLGCGGGGSSDDPPEPPPLVSAGEIKDFLWKPESDAHSRSPGNLVVLVNPCNADVRVNGISLTPSGPSNGRCTTTRGNQPGCGYGRDIKIEVFDPATGNPYFFPTGEPFYVVTNGCVREEFVL